MTKAPEGYWKHATGTGYTANGVTLDAVGVDLFDDEEEGYVSIYARYKDGTRWPARTVRKAAPYFQKVIDAWAKYGKVNDYRNEK